MLSIKSILVGEQVFDGTFCPLFTEPQKNPMRL